MTKEYTINWNDIVLWEEMSQEKKQELEDKWKTEGERYAKLLRDSFFYGNNMHRELKELAFGKKIPSCDEEVRPAKRDVFLEIPKTPGFYTWYVLDLQWMDIGLVQVLQVRNQKEVKQSSKSAYYYQVDGKDLVMVYDGDHRPFIREEDFKPIVDGFIPFNFDLV